MKVRDIMTRNLVAVEAETPLRECIAILQSCGLSSLPVVDEEDRIVGIVSERDVIEALLPDYHETLQGTPFAPDPDVRLRLLRELGDRPVGAFMTTPVITLEEHEDDLYAADLIFKKNLRLVPVVDASGRLAGVVRRIDLLKTLG